MSVAVRENPGLLGNIQAILARKGRRVWNLSVVEKVPLAQRFVRVRFRGEDLDELVWRRGQDLVLEFAAGDGIARRHYTIRNHDPKTRTLEIDFVLHGDGPSGAWLHHAKPGDRILAAGPRGRTVIDPHADWHLFIGDETAIPAIFAMLEGPPSGARAFALLEIESEADKLPFSAPEGVSLKWVLRFGPPKGSGTPILAALETWVLPKGLGHAYTIGETAMVRAVRHRLIERGLGKHQISAEGYWRPGRIGGHDHV